MAVYDQATNTYTLGINEELFGICPRTRRAAWAPTSLAMRSTTSSRAITAPTVSLGERVMTHSTVQMATTHSMAVSAMTFSWAETITTPT